MGTLLRLTQPLELKDRQLALPLHTLAALPPELPMSSLLRSTSGHEVYPVKFWQAARQQGDHTRTSTHERVKGGMQDGCR